MDCYQDEANRRQPLLALNLDLGYFHWHILLGDNGRISSSNEARQDVGHHLTCGASNPPFTSISLSIACTHGGMAGGMSNARPAGVRLVKEIDTSSPLPHEAVKSPLHCGCATRQCDVSKHSPLNPWRRNRRDACTGRVTSETSTGQCRCTIKRAW